MIYVGVIQNSSIRYRKYVDLASVEIAFLRPDSNNFTSSFILYESQTVMYTHVNIAIHSCYVTFLLTGANIEILNLENLPSFIGKNPEDHVQLLFYGKTSFEYKNTKLLDETSRPVTISTGNISIYKYDDKHFRQYIPTQDCTLNNETTISCNVLSSTFNEYDSKYYIQVSDNFAKDRIFNEPITGISDRLWNFQVEKKDGNPRFSGSVRGLLCLNEDGKKDWEINDHHKFYDDLKKQLADIIPVDEKKLKPSYRSQTNSECKTALLSYEILTDHFSEKTVMDIINDLDTLIINKKYTEISRNDPSNYLEAFFGFKILPIAEIEALEILSSNFAGLKSLSANFSGKAQQRIFWCSMIGIFIEDIPQLVIQQLKAVKNR
ncbi:11516_t:CDS:2 [Ambispora gerdemannii]|uniref:11516_t:CDS:1 n=1 Tax=Ambispora gerdemannii TaxID=144530 RepID=A0A9N9BY32_9GLOM|nr:11516_t:CDS:2 [Ambispora gerdemannii]